MAETTSEDSTFDKSSDDEMDKVVEIRDDDERLLELMQKDYQYPQTQDDDFQEKIFKKREFYYNKIPERPDTKTYDQIKEFREKICNNKFELMPHQSFISNFVNPETPYKSSLLMHGTGVE
jgi:hypothetical protein